MNLHPDLKISLFSLFALCLFQFRIDCILWAFITEVLNLCWSPEELLSSFREEDEFEDQSDHGAKSNEEAVSVNENNANESQTASIGRLLFLFYKCLLWNHIMWCSFLFHCLFFFFFYSASTSKIKNFSWVSKTWEDLSSWLLFIIIWH